MAHNGITPNEWFERLKSMMREQAGRCAVQAQQWAVNNHTWENVTGEAEQGLRGYVVKTDKEIGFGLGHTMWYGKYIETIHDGKHGICQKAVDHFIPEFNQQIMNGMRMRPK